MRGTFFQGPNSANSSNPRGASSSRGGRSSGT